MPSNVISPLKISAPSLTIISNTVLALNMPTSTPSANIGIYLYECSFIAAIASDTLSSIPIKHNSLFFTIIFDALIGCVTFCITLSRSLIISSLGYTAYSPFILGLCDSRFLVSLHKSNSFSNALNSLLLIRKFITESLLPRLYSLLTRTSICLYLSKNSSVNCIAGICFSSIYVIFRCFSLLFVAFCCFLLLFVAFFTLRL